MALLGVLPFRPFRRRRRIAASGQETDRSAPSAQLTRSTRVKGGRAGARMLGFEFPRPP